MGMTGDEGVLKESPSPLLEFIDTGTGQLFDSHLLNGLGSSSSSSSSLHSGEHTESVRPWPIDMAKKQQDKQRSLMNPNKQMRNRAVLGFQGYDDFESKMLQSGYRQQLKSNRLMAQLGDDTNKRHYHRNHNQQLDRSTMSSLSRPQVDQGGETKDDDNEKSNSNDEKIEGNSGSKKNN